MFTDTVQVGFYPPLLETSNDKRGIKYCMWDGLK